MAKIIKNVDLQIFMSYFKGKESEEIMIEEIELIRLLFAIGILASIFLNLKKLNKIKYIKYLISSYSFLFLGWIFTILEGLFWGEVLNLFEHLAYTLSAFLLFVWCFRISKIKRELL